ncbi:MAG: type II secretion system minor pseudopilin GspK [Pseudomonadales bacterium]
MSIAFPPNKYSVATRQKGAALIMALMVVVMVTLLATTIGNDFLVNFRRVENQLLGKQAHAYMHGAEGLARNALQLDFQSSPAKDHISEGWLDTPQEFPMDQGVLSGKICDLQGRFNLNNLPKRASPASSGKYSFHQEVFIRLLQTLELDNPVDQQQAEDITNAVVDWIDTNNIISSTGGAEDGYYADLEPPYRAGNYALHSTSELRWVKGISDELYRALAPHITVLNVGSSININTAGINVLRSLNAVGALEPISELDAQGVINKRDGDVSGGVSGMNPGFSALTDFNPEHPAPPFTGSELSVASDYFLLDSTIIFMERKFKLYSVLYREPTTGNIKTIARGQSGLGTCYTH